MHIAICDDNSLELTRLAKLLDTYRQERSVNLTYKAYQNATELLFNIKQCQYDLLLLDILMPHFTGIEAAHEVRTFNRDVKIIFLTSSPDFAVASYAVRAKDYLLKPVSQEKLFTALDAVFAEESQAIDGLSIKTSTGIAKILFSRLAFVEVMNKRLYFHLTDGSEREVHAPLTEYEQKLLAKPEFIKTHRSYIVNLWQVSELTASSFITMNGDNIPISRLLYSQVRQYYMEHLFTDSYHK